MRRDESGVAGFFEDLPVLMFVLAGTFTIVASAIACSQAIVSREEDARLQDLASRSVDLVVSELLEGHPDVVVTISALCATRLGNALKDFLGSSDFGMSIVMVHPELRWICTESNPGRDSNRNACSDSRIVSVLTEDGYVGIILVRVLVW